MDKIVVFGTGNAGRAIYKKFSKEHEIVAFIDNNKDMIGKKYKNIPVFSPNEWQNLEFDYIAYSGIWHKQMKNQLEKLNLSSDKIKHIPENELIYTSQTRQEAVDEAVKKLDDFLTLNKINYFIEGSSALYLLRGKPLSCAADVDFFLTSYDDFMVLEKALPNILPDFNIRLRKYEATNELQKSGQTNHIILTNDKEVVIDIGVYYEYKNYWLTSCGNDGRLYFYMPKEIMEAGILRKNYNGFNINLPFKYDEYFTQVYGKDYLQIPKSWSGSDYKNIISFEDLNK